jgi:hypothetical protein
MRRLGEFSNRIKVLRLRSDEAVKLFKSFQLDFVYLDANHSFHSVISDLESWCPKIRPGGLMCGHDFFNAEADTHLNPVRFDTTTSHPELTSYGVKAAVEHFCQIKSLSFHVTTEQKWPSWYFHVKADLASL